MEGFKSLLFFALLLAMLASSALSAVPVLGPYNRFAPISAEEQLFDGLQQQDDMANDPEAYSESQTNAPDAFVQQEPCYQSLYIIAFTSGLKKADSDDRAFVEMRLRNGEISTIRLYDRKGDDYVRYKGDMWQFDLYAFGFNDNCITRSDIVHLALLEGGNDGWNIDSVITLLQRKSYYRILSRDFHVDHWLDGNDGDLSHLRFDLTLV